MNDPQEPPNPNLEELWQFAGQGLKSSDFNTALVHMYRAEVTRANVWRSRLDTTTNWAVITTGAALTFTFGSPQNTSIIMIVDSLLVLMFLTMEARRYRYYELWSYRVRLIETGFLANLMSPPFMPASNWANQISDSLTHPTFPITFGEAFGRRLRRNYIFLFLILAGGWIVKTILHPFPTTSFALFLERAGFGIMPGWISLAMGVLFHLILFSFALFTIGQRQAQGEVFSEDAHFLARMWQKIRRVAWEIFETDLPHFNFTPHFETRKRLVYIIANEPERIGKKVMQKLGRGVTKLHGQGLYTGAERDLLFCVCTATQVPILRQLVAEIDPQAFLIVTQTQEVRGAGFRPLEA